MKSSVEEFGKTNDAEKQLRKEDLQESVSVSIAFEADPVNYPVKLKFTNSKNLFLGQIVLYLILGALPCIAIAFMVLLRLDKAKIYYRQFYINYTFCYALGLSILIKVIVGLFGHKMTGRKN